MISGKIAKQSRTMTAGSTMRRPEWRSSRSAQPGLWATSSMASAAVAVIGSPTGQEEEKTGAALRGAAPGACLFGADSRLVGGKLLVLADLVVQLVPAVGDHLHGGLLVDLAGQEARDRLVQHDLLVLLVLRHAQVEDHVRAVHALVDSAEIDLGLFLAHAGLLPQLAEGKLRGAVGIEAGAADGHVRVRLRGLGHEGEVGVGRVLHLRAGRSVDAAAPAAEGRERRVVHAVDSVGAAVGRAG